MIKIRQQLMLLVLSCFSLQLMLMDPLYLDQVQITLAEVTTLVLTTICKFSPSLSLSQGWQWPVFQKCEKDVQSCLKPQEQCSHYSTTTTTITVRAQWDLSRKVNLKLEELAHMFFNVKLNFKVGFFWNFFDLSTPWGRKMHICKCMGISMGKWPK